MTVKKGLPKKALTPEDYQKEREAYWARIDAAERHYVYAELETVTDFMEGDEYSASHVSVEIGIRECTECHALVNSRVESMEQHSKWHNAL